jgi:hypothetical protein
MELKVNHKLYLYRPDGTPSSFLGELIVDNLQTDIKLQEISTISFRIPEVINGEVNPRVDEVLDSYIVELWYGKIDGNYEDGDFEKIRFRIYSTPLEFSEYKYLHSYLGYSLESDLEFKQIVSWPGIEVKDFFRTIKYNNTEASAAFTEPGFSYSLFTSTNVSETKYIKILPTAQPSALDIFIYEKRINTADNSESEASLIELVGITDPNNSAFKPGYYILKTFQNIVTEIYIALPSNIDLFNGQNVNVRNLSYRLYDNPVSRAFAVGIRTNTEEPLSNMYIDLAQDAATGDDTPEYGGYTFNTQAVYSKNGLKLNDILTGLNNAEDGLLYKTGFSIGVISSTIAAKYRSNIDFNNITTYQAIKDVASSFDAIAVFDSINKTVSFYAENEYGTNNGLIIKYATYLKSINKEIDGSKIITSARALGKDNINVTLLNPTGSEYWEDYSYFLDGFHIKDTEGFEILLDIDYGLTINYPTTEGLQSRWMDPVEALKVAKWQFTRDYFHNVLSDKNAFVYGILHEPFRGLYEERSAAINLYVKYETQLEKKKADEYKFYYLFEHYRNLFTTKGTNLTQYQYYEGKYNEAKQQAQDFENGILKALYENLYNENLVGTIAYRFALIRKYLDKNDWGIDLEKLRTFQRETTHNDSKIDNEYDLLTATKTFIDENKQPKVTFNISIIDVLEAEEAYQDWDKFKIGQKIYVYFPEFNIDVEAQIREISINFHGKSLNLVISTVRDYNRSFGNYLTKALRRFYNANMNTVMYYKDATDVSIQDTNSFRRTFETGIDASETNLTTGATDGTTGEQSTTTGSEGQQSRVVTGVDIYTETLQLSQFTTGVKINDGRILTFKPYNVSGSQWLQEVEVSAENGFAIRRVYSQGSTILVDRLAYIDADDGEAYFAGWRLNVGQFSSGTGNGFVSINSQPIATNPYAFWSGNQNAADAPFSIKKDGTIKAEKGLIAGLTIERENSTLVKFYAGAGTFGNQNTPFYLNNSGEFSLSNKLTFQSGTLTVNGTIVASEGFIGGWKIETNQLSSGAGATYVGINSAAPASGNSLYAFWAGSETASSAPFNITKSGAIKATAGTISGLNIGTGYKSVNDRTNEINKKNAIFKRVNPLNLNEDLPGVWGEDQTRFYLDEDGRFSLSNEIKWDPVDNIFFVNGEIQADIGSIGGFKITETTIQQGEDQTRFVIKSDPEAPYLAIKQLTQGYNNTGIFIGIDEDLDELNEPVYIPKLSLVGNTSALTFDGDKLSINGGSLTVGENTVSEGSIQITENGVYGYYNGNLNPTFALNNSTGQLNAVDIFLKAGEKTAEIGNLTGSLAGDFGLEITNNGGYYLDKTDISFSESTKRISSITTDLSVYKKGNKISVTDSLDNNGVFTVASDGVTILDIEENILGYYVEVEEDLTDEIAGTELSIARAKPFKVSVTDEGFYILTVDSLEETDTAMSVRYDNNRIWAKRLLIADLEDEGGASVVIGTIAANDILETPATYGVIAKTTKTVEIEGQQVERTNVTYMTAEGFKIVQNGQITFIVNPEGNITAKTLFIEGNSRLAGWLVQDDHFRSANYNLTAGQDFSNAGIRFNNDGSIRGRQFRIDTDGNAFFKGDLTAATGTFGDLSQGHAILGNSSKPLQVKNNDTDLIQLFLDGTLKVANFTVTGSSLYTNIKESIDAISNGVYLGDDGIALGEAPSGGVSPFKVTSAGFLTANSGKIANWNIGLSSLNGGTVAGNYVGMSTGVGTDSDISFWAGAQSNLDSDISAAPFRVNNIGAMFASSGLIGGWSINTTSLSSNSTAFLSVGQGTNTGFSKNGIFLGNVLQNDGITYAPAMSLEGTLPYNYQTFSGTYTDGAYNIDDWSTLTPIYTDYASAPNFSLVVHNVAITPNIINPRESGIDAGYLVYKAVSVSGSNSNRISFNLNPDLAYIISFDYIIRIISGSSSAGRLRLILNETNIFKEYIGVTGSSPNSWRDENEIIPIGTKSITFEFAKTSTTNYTLLIGLDKIRIQSTAGMSYDIVNGVEITDGVIGGWEVTPTSLTTETVGSISIGQGTNKSYNANGLFIGNKEIDDGSGNITYTPAFSVIQGSTIANQEFNSTYTQGDTNLNGFSLSSGVYLDYSAAPNQAFVVTNQRETTDVYGFAPRTSEPYYLLYKNINSSTANATVTYTLDSSKNHNLSFYFAYARFGVTTGTRYIRVSTNLSSNLYTYDFGSRSSTSFRQQSLFLVRGTTTLTFTFYKLGTVSSYEYFGLDGININETSGLSYDAADGLNIIGGSITGSTLSNIIDGQFINGVTIGTSSTAASSIRISTANGGQIAFEGTTEDSSETFLRVTDPTADRVITLPDQSGSISVWQLVGGSETTATTLAFTDATTVPTFTLNSSSGVSAGDLIALEVSQSSSTTTANSRQIIFTRLGSAGATTAGVAMAEWSTLNSSTSGEPRNWSVYIYRSGTDTLTFRYGGYYLPTSTAAKTFGTFYVFRIWKVSE